MSPRIPTAIFLCAALLAAPGGAQQKEAQQKEAQQKEQPGRERDSTLLPNGWRIAPAGRHTAVGELPLSSPHSPHRCCALMSSGGHVPMPASFQPVRGACIISMYFMGFLLLTQAP